MTFKLPKPASEREKYYNKVKAMFELAVENNAINNWMFDVDEEGNLNEGSVVRVDVERGYIYHVTHISSNEKQVYPMKRVNRRLMTDYNGEPKIEKTWMAFVTRWDMTSGRYLGKSITIRDEGDTPTIQELIENLDFDALDKRGNLSFDASKIGYEERQAKVVAENKKKREEEERQRKVKQYEAEQAEKKRLAKLRQENPEAFKADRKQAADQLNANLKNDPILKHVRKNFKFEADAEGNIDLKDKRSAIKKSWDKTDGGVSSGHWWLWVIGLTVIPLLLLAAVN